MIWKSLWNWTFNRNLLKLNFLVFGLRVWPFSVFGFPYLRILVFVVTVSVIFAFTVAVLIGLRFARLWAFYGSYCFILVTFWASLHQMESQSIEIIHSDDRFGVCVYYPPNNILFDSISVRDISAGLVALFPLGFYPGDVFLINLVFGIPLLNVVYGLVADCF